MVTAVLVRGGGRLFLIDPDARTARSIGPDPSRTPPPRNASIADAVGPRLAGARGLRAADPWVREFLATAGVPAEVAPLGELRIARETLPWPPFRSEREELLAYARRRLAEQLASPEETLIALAREEERVERVRSREQGASDQWMAPATGPLAEYAGDWAGFRTSLEHHHAALELRLEQEAERSMPNLSAVVGPKVAARLVAAAGGIAPLARISASRLQLLGARRRAGGNRGPKYGVLARSVHLPEVPPAARGAFARSLAALAAIAARADALTHASLAPFLRARRDRRLQSLRARYRS